MLECYLTAGMPLARLWGFALRKGVSPRYLGRLAFLSQAGLAATAFGAEPLPDAPVEDPLIILGHWRTGTTFLHQLLHHDPRFAAPTLLQTVYPEAFALAREKAAPRMAPTLPATRPMDGVRLALDEPQEDEGALWRMTGLSPLERLVFPEHDRYFLLEPERLLPPDADLPRWEEALVRFVRRVAHATGKRVVLKNPFHSVRVPVLERLFPDARYVRIVRDPREVIPSTVHMWSVVGEQNRLKAAGGPPSLEDVITVFAAMQSRMEADLAAIPPGRQTTIHFPALEAHPTETVGAALRALGLGFPAGSEAAVRTFADGLRGYGRADRRLPDADRELIEERLAAFLAPPREAG